MPQEVAVKQNYYSSHIGDLKRRLRESIGRDDLAALHRVAPGRHFVVSLRQVVLFALCAYLLFRFDDPRITLAAPPAWVPWELPGPRGSLAGLRA